MSKQEIFYAGFKIQQAYDHTGIISTYYFEYDIPLRILNSGKKESFVYDATKMLQEATRTPGLMLMSHAIHPIMPIYTLTCKRRFVKMICDFMDANQGIQHTDETLRKHFPQAYYRTRKKDSSLGKVRAIFTYPGFISPEIIKRFKLIKNELSKWK